MMSLKQAWIVAKKMSNKSSANSKLSSHVVDFDHEDGSRFHFNYASIMEYYDPDEGGGSYPGEYYFIFTEHHGFYVFSKEEVTHISQRTMASYVPPLLHETHPKKWWVCQKCWHTTVKGGVCHNCGSKKIKKETLKDRYE